MDEEESALEAVLSGLRAEGHDARVLRRPDHEDRNKRAVDFEIDFDDALIAVEITSASQFAAQLVVTEQFADAVENELRPFVEEHHLGWWVLALHYEGPLRKRDVSTMAARLAAEAKAVLLAEMFDTVSVDNPPHPLASVDITRIANTPHRVSHVSMPLAAYFVEGTVDGFIDWLLTSKSSQARDYSDVWIIILSRTGAFGASDLAEGFERHRDDIPVNWRRIYYLEGTGPTEVFRFPRDFSA
jgi:hypothetical protein